MAPTGTLVKQRRMRTGKSPRSAPDSPGGLNGDLERQSKPPSEAELSRMTDVEDIYWSTGPDEQTHYEVGQDVVIMPRSTDVGKRTRHDLKETELWRGRIEEIRVPDTDRPDDAWMVVAWYYSPAYYYQLETKGFRKRDLGDRELILVSTHLDTVHANTLNGPEDILRYDETDYDQVDIPRDAFYTRSEYDHKKNKWINPPPVRECLCEQTYKLYDDKEMHYCPRPGCHTWYHEDCLRRGDHLLRTSAATEIEKEWEFSFDEDYLGEIKEEVANLARGSIKAIPDRLREYAHRPIIKGGHRYRVIGNVATVLRARWILYQATHKKMKIPVDWRDYCKYTLPQKEPQPTPSPSSGPANAQSKGKAAGKKRKLEEVKTDAAELLETEKRTRRSYLPHFEHMRERKAYIAFICPKCQKAI